MPDLKAIGETVVAGLAFTVIYFRWLAPWQDRREATRKKLSGREHGGCM